MPMPDADTLRALKLALKIWHQNTCYPTASEGELEIGADAVLTALRALAATDTASAVERMRERCARWHEDEARRYDGLALNAHDRILGASGFRQRGLDHREYAAAICALPITPADPASGDGGGR